MSPKKKDRRNTEPQDRYPDDLYLRRAVDDELHLRPDAEYALRDTKASRAQVWAVALGILLIVGLVLYGINQQTGSDIATAPTTPTETTGAAAPGNNDQAAEGEKPAQPQGEQPAPQGEQPAQQDKLDTNEPPR
jgi:hypothetical protein